MIKHIYLLFATLRLGIEIGVALEPNFLKLKNVERIVLFMDIRTTHIRRDRCRAESCSAFSQCGY